MFLQFEFIAQLLESHQEVVFTYDSVIPRRKPKVEDFEEFDFASKTNPTRKSFGWAGGYTKGVVGFPKKPSTRRSAFGVKKPPRFEKAEIEKESAYPKSTKPAGKGRFDASKKRFAKEGPGGDWFGKNKKGNPGRGYKKQG